MYQKQVSFSEAISMAFNKYCCFSGRASRSEYWWFYLFGLILSAVAGGIAMVVGDWITYVLSVAMLLPGLGLCVRRLHDIGKGGGWIFINLIPLVGQILWIIWACQNSEMQSNRFGDVPNLTAA